ncbi:hypothetical protein TNCV_3689551 [Trichonephila clavipes]|uniref:Reverse transcriptase domain-containing protein n=1 Tax=Trichonephila clavipes TaxID=2585209 RepID=A0A8X6VFQ7_TRICX|nr:hypothetical protein TNCV_3689551 [Trichonephila clavipes]
MIDHRGLDGRSRLLDIFMNSWKKIRVKYNSSMSKGFKLSQRLPQESVLCPTLFTLFMCVIEEVISRRCEVGLFADDIVIWKSGADISLLEPQVVF